MLQYSKETFAKVIFSDNSWKSALLLKGGAGFVVINYLSKKGKTTTVCDPCGDIAETTAGSVELSGNRGEFTLEEIKVPPPLTQI